MDFKRVWHSFRLWTFRSAKKRADYLRKHHIYASIGVGCSFQSRKIPLYANLIKIGDFVDMVGNVSFLTHDFSHVVLNRYKGTNVFRENAGCIEIGNNVSIGSKVVIYHDVKIGDNVIIAPGSVVESDIPPNCMVGGDPARILCSLDVLCAIRSMKEPYPCDMKLRKGDSATAEAAAYLWGVFDKKHQKVTEQNKEKKHSS